MSAADDKKHREGEFYYPTENITLPSIVIDRKDVLFGSFIRVRAFIAKIQRVELKKKLFTGMVGPYREIFLYTYLYSGK